MITTPSQQTTQQTRTQTMMPLLALCLGYFMTILDVTIVNVALVDIKEHLSANVTGLQWIVDGYALVFASFLLTGGALGDRRGRRTVFLAGLALFTKLRQDAPVFASGEEWRAPYSVACLGRSADR